MGERIFALIGVYFVMAEIGLPCLFRAFGWQDWRRERRW